MRHKVVKALSKVVEEHDAEGRKMLDAIKKPSTEGDILYLLDFLKGRSGWGWKKNKDKSVTIEDEKGDVLAEIGSSLVDTFLNLAGIKKGWLWKLAGEKREKLT